MEENYYSFNKKTSFRTSKSNLAKETGQYFVNYRWLGGMLTNWNTIQNSIKRLKKLNEQLSKENLGFTKKEILKFGKEKEKLQRSLRWNC